jgi:poly-beta-1,6-N-acetyl-D-glucosamine synthase
VTSTPAQLGGLTWRARPVAGLRPVTLFCVASLLTAGYLWFDVRVSAPWREDLEAEFGPVAAWVIPALLAYVPAVVIGFFLFTLLLSTYREQQLDVPGGAWPAVTVLIAAWNEEAAIGETIGHIAASDYPGALTVVLGDNNSTDGTAAVAQAAATRLRLDYRRVFEPAPGKHKALNTALETVTTPLVATIDADTFMHPGALARLVAAVVSRPQEQHVSAVAGALFVENPVRNFLTRMQSWDYRLGINGVKRMQAAYNTTLVAQGAFSVYWTDDVRAVGGWPDAIGEDIVLTWRLLSHRGVIRFEPLAIAFTVVPERTKALLSQRSRWARGMFEALKINPPLRQPRVLAKLVSAIDYLVPFLDVGYVFFWIPGVVLFLIGKPIIFGWWSMLMIPVTVTIYGLLRAWQERHVVELLGLRLTPDRRGFFGYLFAFRALAAAASLRGYTQFVFGAGRRWR